MTVELVCDACGGTKFFRTNYLQLWENETIDVATGEKSTEEVEREFMETIEGWMCAKDGCYGYVDREAQGSWEQTEDGYEIEDAFDKAWYGPEGY